MRTKAILAAMVLALVPLPSVAQDFNAGLAAYGRSDYDTALREWKPLAEQGNVMAQKFVALLYQFGDGVTEDYAEAVRWYRAAAEQGDVGAQLTLGRMFAEGQELDVAASLLQEKRVVRGIEQDYTEALRWFHAAAEQGDDEAQYRLGEMYASGHGVTQDFISGHMWFNVAATNGSSLAPWSRDTVEDRMAPTDVSEAQRRARVCMESGYQDCGAKPRRRWWPW